MIVDYTLKLGDSISTNVLDDFQFYPEVWTNETEGGICYKLGKIGLPDESTFFQYLLTFLAVETDLSTSQRRDVTFSETQRNDWSNLYTQSKTPKQVVIDFYQERLTLRHTLQQQIEQTDCYIISFGRIMVATPLEVFLGLIDTKKL